MIKHRKIIICILLSYALFIVGIFNVDALVYSNDVSFYAKTTTPMGYPNRKSISLQYNTDNPSTMGVLTWVFNTEYVVSCETDNCLIVIPYTAFVTNRTILGNYEGVTDDIDISDFSFTTQVAHSSSNYYSSCTNQDNNIECVVPNNQLLASMDIIVNKTLGTLGGDSSNIFSLQTLGFWYVYNMGQNTQAIQETADNTKDINDTMNDSSIDNNNTSSSTTSWGNKNASNGTITNLLTLPISLLQAIVNGIQSSCSSFSLGSLFGTNIVLPCINIGSLIGSALWSTIDILFSGFMILAIAKKLIKIFNDFTNLKTNQVDELYGGGK